VFGRLEVTHLDEVFGADDPFQNLAGVSNRIGIAGRERTGVNGADVWVVMA
jgi:hypothetical protein